MFILLKITSLRFVAFIEVELLEFHLDYFFASLSDSYFTAIHRVDFEIAKLISFQSSSLSLAGLQLSIFLYLYQWFKHYCRSYSFEFLISWLCLWLLSEAITA